MAEAMIKAMERKMSIGSNNTNDIKKKIIPMILSIWAVGILLDLQSIMLCS